MNISKIKIAIKWLFGGTEAVVDYVLGVLNEFLAQDAVAARVAEGYAIAVKVLGYLDKYKSWCPAKWQHEYGCTVAAVEDCVAAFADSKVTADEIKTVTAAFQAAYKAWMED